MAALRSLINSQQYGPILITAVSNMPTTLWVTLDELETLNEEWSLRRETVTLVHRCHADSVYVEFVPEKLECPGCGRPLPRYLHVVAKAGARGR